VTTILVVDGIELLVQRLDSGGVMIQSLRLGIPEGPPLRLSREETRFLAIALIDEVKETPEEQAARYEALAKRLQADGR